MSFIRFLIMVLFAYFILRLLKGMKRTAPPKVKRSGRKPEQDPFRDADIQDIPYTEVPPDENDDEGKN